MKSFPSFRSLAVAAAVLAVVACFTSSASAGRFAERRAERRQARQAQCQTGQCQASQPAPAATCPVTGCPGVGCPGATAFGTTHTTVYLSGSSPQCLSGSCDGGGIRLSAPLPIPPVIPGSLPCANGRCPPPGR